MNTTLAQLTGRRAWFVPTVSVSGDLVAETIAAVATETHDDGTRVVFSQFDIGGQAQTIAFATLTDHRGNPLPTTIEQPVVIPIARGAAGVAVVGIPTDTSVRLAMTDAAENALVDLWIVEARH